MGFKSKHFEFSCRLNV